jgi:two-component system LytT family sensor kinase
MKKLCFLIVFSFYLLNGYGLGITPSSNALSTDSQTLNINFTTRIKAPDLQIKRLTAKSEKNNIIFTLTYISQKDRYLSFFSPPDGDILKYYILDGLRKNDTLVTFCISKNEFQFVENITMRFSTNQYTETDRNFIFLELHDASVIKLLGLSNHKYSYSKIFPFYSSLFNLIAMWLLIPFLLFMGTKVSSYTTPIEKWITNNWLLFNIKALISSVAIISIILLVSVITKNTLPLPVCLYLLAIPILPANLTYLSEKVFIKRQKMFWMRQYLNLFFITIGFYVSYKFFNELSGKIIARENISLEYVILFGILMGFMRLINNYLLYQKITSLKEKELEIARLNELKVRSDLNALQSKINPHFLYNSLNSIAELCLENPPKAERMALSLSKLFRYSINKEESDFNLLKNEIEIVDLYLSIEKERFGNQLNYQFEFSSHIENLLIPKFILQPLIENAIKHGISKIPNGGNIKLRISKTNQDLKIEVYDNGPDFPVNLISGYGLKSIYDKLDILFPNRYSIEMHNGSEKNITLILKDGI